MDSHFKKWGINVIKAKTVAECKTILEQNPNLKHNSKFRILCTVPEAKDDSKGLAKQFVTPKVIISNFKVSLIRTEFKIDAPLLLYVHRDSMYEKVPEQKASSLVDPSVYLTGSRIFVSVCFHSKIKITTMTTATTTTMTATTRTNDFAYWVRTSMVRY